MLKRRLVAVCSALCLALGLIGSANAAYTFNICTVTSTSDALTPGTLRYCLAVGGSAIVFDFAGTSDQVISPTDPLVINESTSIQGSTYAGKIVLDGSSLDDDENMFEVGSEMVPVNHVEIRNLTIRDVSNGTAPAAIFNKGSSDFAVVGCTFEDDALPITVASNRLERISIVNNRFDRSLMDAVSIQTSVDSVNISYNTVQDGNGGIVVSFDDGESTGVGIGSNIVRRNDGTGIVLAGTNGNVGNSLRGNQVYSNDGSGIVLLHARAEVQVNRVKENGENGIALIGSSSLVTSNVSNSNGVGGIVSVSDPGADPDPSETSDDFVGVPTIGDSDARFKNAAYGNSLAGIALLDSWATNSSTMSSNNDVGSNGLYDAGQAWRGLVEVYDPDTGLGLSSATVTVTGTGGSPTMCYDTTTSDGVACGDPADVNTWPYMLEWTYSGTTLTTYGPQEIHVSATGGPFLEYYSWDGVDNDGTSVFGLPSCVTVGGSGKPCRYQVGEVAADDDP